MIGRRVIGYRRIFNKDGINTNMGATYVSECMEEMGTAVNRLKMRDILFLQPYGVNSSHIVGFENTEHKLILWMGVADRQRERPFIVGTIENQRILIVAAR